jgi:trans-aconitate methyltransferase
MKLWDAAKGCDTDKRTDHSYLGVYEELFAPIRLNKLNLLEIGVKTGGSAKMWLKYFPNARVFGMDIEKQTDLEDPRFTYIGCNQADIDRVPTLFGPNTLDIVIDDGSHFAEDNILTLYLLWSALKPGALYIMEDMQHMPPHWRNSILYWSEHNPFSHLCRKTWVVDRRSIKNRVDDVLVMMQKK